PFPAQLEDVRQALVWLRANASQHRLDPERVAVVGYSSGGSLACLLGTASGGPPARGKAVGAYYPITDFARRRSNQKAPTGLQRLAMQYSTNGAFGGPPDIFPALYADASALNHVTAQAPPTLLIHGTADSLVPPEQSQLYYAALRRAGVPASLLWVEG